MSLEGLRARLLAFEDEALEAISQLHRRIDFLSAKIFNFWAQHCHLSRRVALLEGLPQDTDTTARPIDLHSARLVLAAGLVERDVSGVA